MPLILFVVAWLLLPTPVAAQAFDPGPSIDFLPVTQSRPYSIWGADVDGLPGEELIIDFYMHGTLTVARYHPTKHGPKGSLPGPGICAEAETPIFAEWRAAGDFNADGKADFLIYRNDGSAFVVWGRGFTDCR